MMLVLIGTLNADTISFIKCAVCWIYFRFRSSLRMGWWSLLLLDTFDVDLDVVMMDIDYTLNGEVVLDEVVVDSLDVLALDMMDSTFCIDGIDNYYYCYYYYFVVVDDAIMM